MKFDHIEAHVSDIKRYCDFLLKIFQGGQVEVLTSDGISMFTSPDGLNVEVKKREGSQAPILSGFTNPCLRTPGAKEFIEKVLKLRIVEERKTLEGRPVYFFKDHEGEMWHMKDMPE